ncbi:MULTISPECIES: hypothetical protein [unclassified Pseudomonas]|uniref:hypothetical protein n=1 Tax=unclassified Pseudomonas TaxID=196821 RepID=UPI00385D45DD
MMLKSLVKALVVAMAVASLSGCWMFMPPGGGHGLDGGHYGGDGGGHYGGGGHR